MSDLRTNILVQYQGGGYDGCFWEWNYFFIDAEGKFFNIVATGRNGITRAEDAESVLDSSHTYTYDVSSDEEMHAFAVESNPAHVVLVVRWLIGHGMGEHAEIVCSRCGGHVNLFGPHLGAWKGDGGIGVQPMEVYCENCVDEEDVDAGPGQR